MLDQDSKTEEFIVVRAGGQEFCVEMASTREIRGWTPATKLPNSDGHVVSIINLRGTILPIVDLALRLGLSKTEPSERHVIIVMRIHDKEFGLLVDSVSDIVNVDAEQLRPVPELNHKLSEEFFRQVIVMENRIICEVVLSQLVPELDKIAA